MRCIFSLIILLASVTTVSAGGTFFPVEILQIEIDSTDSLSFMLKARLVNSKKNSEVGNCEIFTVKGYYDHNKWKKYKRPMSEETHIQSLEFLKNAHESKETILFGAMGNGLIKLDICFYESKGLFIEQHNGEFVVFSVNDSI